MTSFVNGPLLFFFKQRKFLASVFFAADEKKGKKTLLFKFIKLLTRDPLQQPSSKDELRTSAF